MPVQYQVYRPFRPVKQPFQKIYKPFAVHLPLKCHKSHLPLGTNCRHHVQAKSSSCCRDHWGFPNRRPCRATMIIRPHICLIPKVDFSPLFLGLSLDFRIGLLLPDLYLLFISLVGSAQRLLWRQSQLAQHPTHRGIIERYLEFLSDEFSHHRARPQGKFKIQLRRILFGNHAIQLLKLFPV